MWKSPNTPPASPSPSASPVTPEKKELRPMDGMRQDSFRSNSQDVAHIGKSVVIKGELSGSEDLYLDGEVEGSIDLQDHSLTIGPHGRVRANVLARDVVVHGKVDGNVQGTERVELKRSAVLMGDISTQRIVIEDGAYFKGAIDIKKEAKPVTKAETPKAFAAAASPTSSFTPQN
jgi:cytoskeletal protein CcmA (bactofilin family)